MMADPYLGNNFHFNWADVSVADVELSDGRNHAQKRRQEVAEEITAVRKHNGL
jgi:hypothetical protein